MALFTSSTAYLIGGLGRSYQLYAMDKVSAIKYCRSMQIACLEHWLPEETVREHGDAKTWVLDNMKDSDYRTSVIFDTANKAMCHLILYRVSESKSPPIVSLHAIVQEPFNRRNLSYKDVISALDTFCASKKLYLQHQDLNRWQTYKTRRVLDACAEKDSPARDEL